MRKRNVVVGVAVVVAIAGLTASIAVARIPNSTTGEINGCRSIKGGALRVVDTEAGQQCGKTEQAVNWSGDTRKTYLVRRGAYNSPRDVSATPLTLMSVMPPTIAEGTWLLTARIPTGNSDVGATISCIARGAAGSYGHAGTFEDSDSVTVGAGGSSVIELQTIAMTTRDFDTDELVPITVSCTGTAPEGGNAMIAEYQIALIPVPSSQITE